MNETTRIVAAIALLIASAGFFLNLLLFLSRGYLNGVVVLAYLLVVSLFLFGAITILRMPVERPPIYWRYTKKNEWPVWKIVALSLAQMVGLLIAFALGWFA